MALKQEAAVVQATCAGIIVAVAKCCKTDLKRSPWQLETVLISRQLGSVDHKSGGAVSPSESTHISLTLKERLNSREIRGVHVRLHMICVVHYPELRAPRKCFVKTNGFGIGDYRVGLAMD